MNASGGMFKACEMARKEKRLAVVRAQRFVNAIAEQHPVVENRDLRILWRCDYAVDIDTDVPPPAPLNTGGELEVPARARILNVVFRSSRFAVGSPSAEGVRS